MRSTFAGACDVSLERGPRCRARQLLSLLNGDGSACCHGRRPTCIRWGVAFSFDWSGRKSSFASMPRVLLMDLHARDAVAALQCRYVDQRTERDRHPFQRLRILGRPIPSPAAHMRSWLQPPWRISAQPMEVTLHARGGQLRMREDPLLAAGPRSPDSRSTGSHGRDTNTHCASFCLLSQLRADMRC